jgi:transposase
MTMTLADQASITENDGMTAESKHARSKRRLFTAAYKSRILAEFDALPEGAERGALLRRERLYHSHIQDWKRQAAAGTLKNGRNPGKADQAGDPAEMAGLRAENRKLKAANEKLSRDLGKTRTALEIAGKAFALLEDISSSAASSEN